MYLYHFGLQELPFSLTPNTHFYFGLPTHNQAFEVVTTALGSGEGFIKIIGEVGTGKTLVCRKFLNQLPDRVLSAYLPNPLLSPVELRRAIASELGIDLSQHDDQQSFTTQLQYHLVKLHQRYDSVVLVVDEAQALPAESLEALRLVTNLETENRKLLQVILFAQPELDAVLAKNRLRQLRQRITFCYYLEPLTADQTQQYLNYRLQTAGYRGDDLFTSKVAKRLYQATGGIPRLINITAHKCLMLAYGEGVYKITLNHLNAALQDGTFGETVKPPSRPWLTHIWPWLIILMAMAVLVVATLHPMRVDL